MVSNGDFNFFFQSAVVMSSHSRSPSLEDEATEDSELEIQAESSVDFERESQVRPKCYELSIFFISIDLCKCVNIGSRYPI